jgi:hypothetical protein
MQLYVRDERIGTIGPAEHDRRCSRAPRMKEVMRGGSLMSPAEVPRASGHTTIILEKREG